MTDIATARTVKIGIDGTVIGGYCGHMMRTTNLQERTALVESRTAEILAHPMCGRLTEDRGYYYVTYPAGDFPVDGIRATKSGGKWVALGHILIVMERHWKESFPGFVRNKEPDQ